MGSTIQESSLSSSPSTSRRDPDDPSNPPLESPTPSSLIATPPPARIRQDSQRDVKAMIPHNTYDYVVIDDESPVPSPRKTKHAAVRIGKLELEDGLNQLIDISSSGWTDEVSECSSLSPLRDGPPKPPPRG